jgi:uncharacterized protein YegL
MSDLPGGPLASRPLRFFWALDVSSSMAGYKIGELNFAVREALEPMRQTADENPHASVEVSVLTFGTGTKWLTPGPVKLEAFSWTDLTVNGWTDMGQALRELAKELSVDAMPPRSLPPVVVLVTDGQPTDDFEGGLAEFMSQPWAKKAIRIGIAIGSDADLDLLRRFIAHQEMEPLLARNSSDLVRFIKWASTQVVKFASAPPSQGSGSSKAALSPMDMMPPPPPADASATDIW